MSNTNWLSRTKYLLGEENVSFLQNKKVMVLGLGGVGAFAAEFICRAGVGNMVIIDGDTVDETNLNRQLPALQSTIGRRKVDVMEERLKDINPQVQITKINQFVLPDTVQNLFADDIDYYIDAIDSLKPKITFLKEALRRKVKVVSSMGAGGKLDPTQIKVADINKTYNCPFAQYIRKTLRRDKVHGKLKVVFSAEPVIKASLVEVEGQIYKRSAYGTISYLPAAFGGVLSSVVIKKLCKIK